jgi:hypothetical protein
MPSTARPRPLNEAVCLITCYPLILRARPRCAPSSVSLEINPQSNIYFLLIT